MTRVTFENATIRDVIGKAARVAPTKGTAFDKAAGILVEIDSATGQVIVKATNTEVFYMEITDAVEVEGESRTWLIPSSLLDGVTSKLPISSGSQVVFDDEDGRQLKVTSKRMVAKLRLADPTYYPRWGAFDPADLTPVENFAARIQQVQWAACKNTQPPITGIHLSGEHVVATDKFRIAITPCKIADMVKPVTIPSSILNPLMKNLGEVSLGQEDGQLLIMPDESTQIRAVIYEADFPNVMRVIKREEPSAFMCSKDDLIEMIDRAMVIGKSDRTPLLRVIIGDGEVAMMMEDTEMGLLGDVIELPGQVPHPRMQMGFTPDNLKSALDAAPNKEVSFYYYPDYPKKPIRIDGGSGYESVVVPRNLEVSADV